MPTMYSIGEVCDARAGVKSLVFADMTNVVGYGPGDLPPGPGSAPTFTDNDLLYSIAFERHTGEAIRESGSDQGGDYASGRITIFVPKGRAEVDTLLRRWRNRLLFVIGIDRYGSQHIISDAIASWRYTTGTKPGTRHGYEISFSGYMHYIISPIAGDGEISTAPPVGGGSGSGSSSDCCISIQPIAIAYTPALTGNPNNHNELVTTPSGAVYFIDSAGRGICLNRPAPRTMTFQMTEGSTATYVTVPSDFWIPDPDDYPVPTYNSTHEVSRRLLVKLGSRWLEYEDTEGWYMDYATRRIHFNTSIDGALIRLYSYRDIAAIPL